jgi:hypothetical protein
VNHGHIVGHHPKHFQRTDSDGVGEAFYFYLQCGCKIPWNEHMSLVIEVVLQLLNRRKSDKNQYNQTKELPLLISTEQNSSAHGITTNVLVCFVNLLLCIVTNTGYMRYKSKEINVHT